jgi:hypothetical protein
VLQLTSSPLTGVFILETELDGGSLIDENVFMVSWLPEAEKPQNHQNAEFRWPALD